MPDKYFLLTLPEEDALIWYRLDAELPECPPPADNTDPVSDLFNTDGELIRRPKAA